MPGCTSFLMTTWATSRDKATKAQRGTHYLVLSRASFDLPNGDLETEPTNGRQVATLTTLEEFIKLVASHPSCFCSSITTTQIRRAPPRVQAGEKHNMYLYVLFLPDFPSVSKKSHVTCVDYIQPICLHFASSYVSWGPVLVLWHNLSHRMTLPVLCSGPTSPCHLAHQAAPRSRKPYAMLHRPFRMLSRTQRSTAS
jgi:hypothetical protein